MENPITWTPFIKLLNQWEVEYRSAERFQSFGAFVNYKLIALGANSYLDNINSFLKEVK